MVNDGNGYTNKRGLFAWLGRAVVRHPWRVIALWVIAAAAVILTSPGLPSTTNESSFLPKDYESIRAIDLQDKAFPQSGHVTSAAAIIVFSRGGRDHPERDHPPWVPHDHPSQPREQAALVRVPVSVVHHVPLGSRHGPRRTPRRRAADEPTL